jgi:hypothetical protein
MICKRARGKGEGGSVLLAREGGASAWSSDDATVFGAEWMSRGAWNGEFSHGSRRTQGVRLRNDQMTRTEATRRTGGVVARVLARLQVFLTRTLHCA